MHSCLSTAIDDHLFIVDEFNFYKYVFEKPEIHRGDSQRCYPDQNCVGLFVVDGTFCYTLSHSQNVGDRSSGLLLYDINNVLKKDLVKSYVLDKV